MLPVANAARLANQRYCMTVIAHRLAGLLALALLAVPQPSMAEPVRTLHSEVRLVAEQAHLPAAGGAVELALHVRPDAGWHGYWINPGDAGKEPSMRWRLPPGFEAGPLAFPTPTLIPFGAFNTYGFDGDFLLLATLRAPAGLPPGSNHTLGGTASWVVCDDELCVPEQAELALTLSVADGAPEVANADLFAAARDKLPRAVDWPAQFEVADGEVVVDVSLPAGVEVRDPYLFVAAKRFVRYDEQRAERAGHTLRFVMPAGGRAEQASGVSAVLRDLEADADIGSAAGVGLSLARASAPLPPLMGATTPAVPVATSFAVADMLQAIVFGLLGGIVLNLMPCVFPILSMKALGLVQLAGAERRAVRASGLLYTAGVLVAFAAIAVALLALRAAGSAAGWGFQLQSPWVNLGLGLGMVAIGLNLAGVFEIGTRLMGLGGAGQGAGEKRAAFLTGLLAVVVATPCTAPFMAGALGYALVQPAAVAMAVFLALGVGLALPYLALTWIPSLGAALPQPGPWMAVFRQVLAFPMLATALWLFWVVGRQLGASSMAVALLAALLLAFALWAFGRSAVAKAPWRWRVAAALGLAACVGASAQLQDLRAPPLRANAEPVHMLGKLTPQRFSPQLVRDYIGAGQPVFVYFTADWCISCKVNERVALATDAVGEAMNARRIKVVEGDWTAEDPTITEWLTMYGRAGVPLYLYFPRGSAAIDGAVVLPQVLLPDIVVDAIAEADRQAAARRLAALG